MDTSKPKHRIWFQGATDRIAHSAYITKLEAHMKLIIDPAFDYSFNTTTPPATTTHPVTEFRMARNFMKNAVEAERQGYSVMAISHFQDAGLAEVKSMVDIPVLGLGETSMYFACTLGRKFGLVTINPAFIPWHEDQVIRYGLSQRCVGVRAVDCKVSDFMDGFATEEGYAKLAPKFQREVNLLLDAGADVIVPAGGLPMLMFGGKQEGRSIQIETGGAPIINGLTVLCKSAEAAVRMRELDGVGVSRRSNYAKPPALALQEFLEQG
jgi:allantoin racemase